MLDKAGRCCPSTLDACGVCGGKGVVSQDHFASSFSPTPQCTTHQQLTAPHVCTCGTQVIDVRGVCCETPLSPLGICCPSDAPLDSCGVCGGASLCRAYLTINAMDIAASGANRRLQAVGAGLRLQGVVDLGCGWVQCIVAGVDPGT